jgi:hypothetical protein
MISVGKNGRFDKHVCMYTNILGALIETDILGFECGSLDFTEVARYRFQYARSFEHDKGASLFIKAPKFRSELSSFGFQKRANAPVSTSSGVTCTQTHQSPAKQVFLPRKAWIQ